MHIQVVHGDALDTVADVLVLKYAQTPYGVDKLVLERIEVTGEEIRSTLPKPGTFRFIETDGRLPARAVLFVGVVGLRDFDYTAIREFTLRGLAWLAMTKPSATHVAFTLHGPGYGLDESEAFRAELAGIVEAIETGQCPAELLQVSIIERNAGRAQRLQALLADMQPLGHFTTDAHPRRPLSDLESLRTAGVHSRAKPHVFVAMPFAPEFDDLFHYGIQQAVHSAGFLCERADLATFTGDVIPWVKERIGSASLLVADLSTANPNVYLEVGYAWGKGVPTVLVARNSGELKFDVRGQRCLVYNNRIQDLESLLKRELVQLEDARRPATST